MKKIIYMIVGLIAFGIGMIGAIIPMVPTTPLLLLASFCFLKSSERLDEWFRGTKLYKKHIEEFIQQRAMTLKQKIIILACSETMILIPAILINNLIMRIVIVIVMLAKLYYFIFKIKTIRKE